MLLFARIGPHSEKSRRKGD